SSVNPIDPGAAGDDACGTPPLFSRTGEAKMAQKVAYVTGGMGGIGTTMCQRLHKDGFKVIAGCGRSRDFKKGIDEQAALGFTFYTSVGNVGDWDSTVAAFQKTTAEHGPVDVL